MTRFWTHTARRSILIAVIHERAGLRCPFFDGLTQ